MLTEISATNLESFRVEAKKMLNASVRALPGQGAEKQGLSQDRVTLGGGKPDAGLYSAASREVSAEHFYQQLRQKLVSMFQEQGIASVVATDSGEIDLATLSAAEAQALVSEDGFFGVEQTSERIFQFAVQMAGNDTGRFDAVMAGLEKGFREAEEIWGGALPDISYQTRDAVQEKLAAWVEEGKKDPVAG